MRSLLLIFAVFLSGCSGLATRAFDPVEYDYAVMTTVAATRTLHLCGDEKHFAEFKSFLSDLNQNSMYLFEYERHLAGNTNSLVAATQIRQMVIDFTVHPQYSDRYCQHKLSEVQSASRTLSPTVTMGNSGYRDRIL